MEILKCHLFSGKPYIEEKDGKYHVLQGCFTADDAQEWYDTQEEAVQRWNSRVKAAYGYEKSRMGVVRDVNADFEFMKNLIT